MAVGHPRYPSPPMMRIRIAAPSDLVAVTWNEAPSRIPYVLGSSGPRPEGSPQPTSTAQAMVLDSPSSSAISGCHLRADMARAMSGRRTEGSSSGHWTWTNSEAPREGKPVRTEVLAGGADHLCHRGGCPPGGPLRSLALALEGLRPLSVGAEPSRLTGVRGKAYLSRFSRTYVRFPAD